MILLVDLCYREHSLGFEEFVLPVRRIVKGCGFPFREIHYRCLQREDVADSAGIVLCGTPIADNRFISTIQDFDWIDGCKVPVLGICAGMEILTLVYGGRLENCEEIGMTGIRIVSDDTLIGEQPREFQAYELHGYGCITAPGFLVIAESDRCVQMVRHPVLPQIGVMFHPEVRNEWVVENFLSQYAGKP